MMQYRAECLTPVLVSDGATLSPIDYMVWKDQVNVLDQRKIFRLLAKGPRLDGYLNQVKRAQKLDFASWEVADEVASLVDCGLWNPSSDCIE